MRSPYNSGGFATAIIVGGVVVATVVGGIFYFLRGTDSDITVIEKEDEADVVSDQREGVNEALLGGVQREDSNSYYPLLGLDDAASFEDIEDACSGFECKTDEYYEDPSSFRRKVEACLVLRNPAGRALYDEWFAGTRETPFPLYYAVLGLKQDVFDQGVIADAYATQLDLYHSDASCDRSEVLRLLAEAYLTLGNTKGRALYDEWLTSTDGNSFPLYYAIFGLDPGQCPAEDLTDIYQRLLGLYELGFYGDSPEVLRLLTEAYLVLSQDDFCAQYNEWLNGGGGGVFDLGDGFRLEDIGIGLSGMNPENIASFLSALNLGADDVSDVLGGVDGLTPADIAGILNGLDNLTPSGIANILDGLYGIVSADLSGTLGDLDLSPSDLSSVLSGLSMSPSDLSGVLDGLNLSPSDLSNVLSGLTLSPSDLSGVLSGLNMSPSDLSGVLSGLNMSPFDLSGVLSGLNMSPSDLSGVLDGLNLSPLDLSNVLSGLNMSPLDLSNVLDGLNLSPSDFNTVSANLSPSLPTTPSVPTVPPTPPPRGPINFFQGVNQFFNNVLNPNDPNRSDRGPPGPEDNNLPVLSIRAVDPVVSPGDDAAFKIEVVSTSLSSDFYFKYTCWTTNNLLVDQSQIGDTTALTSGATKTFAISTEVGHVGYVRCSLRDPDDDTGEYKIGNESASVSVGIFDNTLKERVRDDYYDPALPTVSITAYRREGREFGEVVDRVVVGSDMGNLGLFGLVIDDFDYLVNLIDELEEVTIVSSDNPYELAKHRTSPETHSRYYVDSDLNIIDLNADDESEGLIDVSFSLNTSDAGSNSNDYVDKENNDGVVSLEKRGGGVVLRRITDNGREVFIICARRSSDDEVVCGNLTETDTLKRPDVLRVRVQCFREFSEPEDVEKYLRELPEKKQAPVGDRELIGAFVGGRYREGVQESYKQVVSNKVDLLASGSSGSLFDLLHPTGLYHDIDSQLYIQIDTPVDIEVVFPSKPEASANDFITTRFEGSISCEIVNDDGYNVNPAARKAYLEILPQPLVSLYGDEGGEESLRSDNVRAIVRRGHPDFKFDDRGIPQTYEGLEGGGKGYDLKSLGSPLKDAAASFLIGFAGCYAASWLNKIPFLGGLEAPVNESTLRTKECGLDGAVAAGATEVLSGIARDYITWAQEGFKDQPLFIQNPTVFYKNMRDDAVGRAIDRSGLGFLCDARFGLDADFFNAKIRLELQQQYSQVTIQPPRCTYSALRNNLDEYANDFGEFREGVGEFFEGLGDAEDLAELFRVLDADVSFTAQSSPSGKVIDITPTHSEATEQLSALHSTLRNAYKEVTESEPFLLSVARVDEAVNQAELEVASTARPPQQIFNPNDPQSLSAFERCSDAENPEGAEDCYVIKGSATSISKGFTDALSAPTQKATEADEWGELGQLVLLAAEATTTGIFKQMLSGNFGERVSRDTLGTLGEISSGNAEEFRISEIGLGKHWWSVFFDDNIFYGDIMDSEMHMLDAVSLLRYITSSLYESPVAEKSMPPGTPYADFDALKDENDAEGTGNCYVNKKGVGPYGRQGGAKCGFYEKWKDVSGSGLFTHYNAVLQSGGGLENSFEKGWFNGWVLKLLEYYWGGGDKEEKRLREETVFRFLDAYRFLSNVEAREEYDSFLERTDNYPKAGTKIVERGYSSRGKHWWKHHEQTVPADIINLGNETSSALIGYLANPLPHRDAEGNDVEVTYPTETFEDLKDITTLKPNYERGLAAIQAARDIYEATLAAHIEIVGTPDEYSDLTDVDPHADAERRRILSGKQYSSAYEAWEIVRDEILQRFRDGTLEVYLPIYEDTELITRSSRGFSPYNACLGDKGGSSGDVSGDGCVCMVQTPGGSVKAENLTTETACKPRGDWHCPDDRPVGTP